jgi:hypothetical protein
MRNGAKKYCSRTLAYVGLLYDSKQNMINLLVVTCLNSGTIRIIFMSVSIIFIVIVSAVCLVWTFVTMVDSLRERYV